MTEIERIKEKGIIPEKFFQEETRNDCLITVARKEIWAVELDLFFEFKRICDKHNLKYFLFYGSLLGAIRHNGFIPWDDDFDVAMLRSDYDKLNSLWSEFKKPYFLENHKTDKECYFSYSTLRNSNTAWVSRILSYNNNNQGMFIDIFPIDNVIPDDFANEKYNQIRNLVKDLGSYMRRNNPYLDENNKKRVRDLGCFDADQVWESVQSLACSYNTAPSNNYWSSCITVYPYEKQVFDKSDFKKNININFEGFEFPVPIGFENILSTLYGNWKLFPPEDARKWHTGSIINTKRSYIDIQKELKEIFLNNNSLEINENQIKGIVI